MTAFENNMTKAEFMRMMADIFEGDPRPNHVNETLGLKLSDFAGWDDWFGFGEWNRGPQKIYGNVKDDNEAGKRFLKEHGFTEKK